MYFNLEKNPIHTYVKEFKSFKSDSFIAPNIYTFFLIIELNMLSDNLIKYSVSSDVLKIKVTS